MIKAFVDMGVEVRHAWGMTEMSPIGTARRAETAVCRTHRRSPARYPADPGLSAVRRPDEDHRRCRQGTAVGRQDLRPAQGRGPGGLEGLFPGRYQHPRRGRLFRHRRRRHHRPVRLHADHRPLQGCDQVRRRMDFVDRSGKSRGRASGGRGSRRDRHPSSQMGRASAADRAAQAGPERDARGHPEIHGWQDRQMVDARRRRVRRCHSAHRDGKDPEDRAARPVQGVQFPQRGGCSRRQWRVANSE